MADEHAALIARGEQVAQAMRLALVKLGPAVAALGRQMDADASKIRAAIDILSTTKPQVRGPATPA